VEKRRPRYSKGKIRGAEYRERSTALRRRFDKEFAEKRSKKEGGDDFAGE
jgi:hypothetical protein